MNYIEYIDLPSVPEHLLESIKDIIKKPLKDADYNSQEHPYFKIRDVNDELKFWIQTIFNSKIFSGLQYQLVYNGVPIHIDRADRIFAYNYLLEAGGDDVKTSVYDSNYNLLQTEKIELKRWHRINTSMLHGVHGIHPNKVRVALSIGLYKNN